MPVPKNASTGPNDAANPNLAVRRGMEPTKAPSGAPLLSWKPSCTDTSSGSSGMVWNSGTIALAAHCPPNMPLQTEPAWRPAVSVATNMPLLRSCFAPALFHREQ